MSSLLALLVITLSEATIGVFVKLIDGSLPIFSVNFYRVFFASLFIGTMLILFSKKKISFPKNNLKDTLLIGVFIALQISLFNIAMTLTPIANAVVFWSIAPFFVFIFSTIFLNEKPRKIHFFIFITAIIGIIIAKPLSEGVWAGNLIALSTGAVYGVMVTYMRHEGKEQQSNDIFWSMAAASIYLLPALFIFGTGDLFEMSNYPLFGAEVPVVLWVVCLGVISTGLAFYLISIVLRKMSANVYSLVDIIFSPFVAAILGFLIFDEVPSINMVVGGSILILSGFFLTRTMQIETESFVRK